MPLTFSKQYLCVWPGLFIVLAGEKVSESLLTGKARVSFKCSPELEAMIEAVARFEHRNTSDTCRIALHEYFLTRGYYEAATLSKLGGTHDEGQSDAEGGLTSSEPGT